ncbi:MAG: succinylglutamate desuccinylase/aspartoacylase family protein [Candidatus Marsarchaeota archaeon]|nr:succinylglutamate desuccinylase/aspartoacylase family protein [Candidatus Marsarchaeota archaeon]
MKTYDIGSGNVKIAVVGSIHGNELVGSRVIARLAMNPPAGVWLRLIVANEAAISLNRRFVDVDGNRCFPGSRNGNTEQRMAFELLEAIEGCDYLIDIHSTFARQPDIIIVTHKRAMALARRIPVKKIVVMERAIANGGSLIDYADCGVSLEFSRSRSTAYVENIVRTTISNLVTHRETSGKEMYHSIRFVPKLGTPSGIRNFIMVKKGATIQVANGKRIRSATSFYPLFFGEKGYAGLCMMLKKIP